MKKLIAISIILFFAQTSFAQKVLKGSSFSGNSVGGNYAKLTFSTQTADYTLVLADSVKEVIMNVSSANVLTVPTNASVAIPIGSVIPVFQYGTGQTTINASVGVTIRSAGARYKLYEQYSSATLTKIATNEWLLVGDLNF